MSFEVVRQPRADALLLTIALILLAWSSVVFILRLLLRLKVLRATQWNTSQVLGWDDAFCALGTTLAAAQTIAFCITIRDREGPLTREGLASRGWQPYPVHYAATLMWLASVGCGKCSMVMLERRIKPDRVFRVACLVVFGGCVSWTAASMVLAGLDCNGIDAWNLPGNTCNRMNLRRFLVGSLDIATEAVLFGLAIWLVWDIQAPWPRKAKFVMASSFRLCVIVATVIRLWFSANPYRRYGAFIPDPDTFLCAQVEAHYGIMAVTIPMLKPIIMGLNTSCGMYGGFELDNNVGTSDRGGTSDRRSSELKAHALPVQNEVNETLDLERNQETATMAGSPSSSSRRRPSQSACSDGSTTVMIRL